MITSFISRKCLIYSLLFILTLVSCATTQETNPSQEIRSDEEITQEVTEKLNERFTLGTPRNFIEVKTVNGNVYLSGTVESSTIKNTAENVAKNVEGVKGVINSILVKSRP